MYGASSAFESYAIKLARNSNIHPIIAVAGKGTHYVGMLLDRTRGDMVVDYRDGVDETTSKIQAHLKAGNYGEVRHGLDPGIRLPSQRVLTEIVSPSGAINLVLSSDINTESATKTSKMVGIVLDRANATWGEDGSDLELVTCLCFTSALQAGVFEGHPFEVRSGGLADVEQALKDLKDGKQSAVKYVFRIADTPGL